MNLVPQPTKKRGVGEKKREGEEREKGERERKRWGRGREEVGVENILGFQYHTST